jgi:hypothetical protein
MLLAVFFRLKKKEKKSQCKGQSSTMPKNNRALGLACITACSIVLHHQMLLMVLDSSNPAQVYPKSWLKKAASNIGKCCLLCFVVIMNLGKGRGKCRINKFKQRPVIDFLSTVQDNHYIRLFHMSKTEFDFVFTKICIEFIDSSILMAPKTMMSLQNQFSLVLMWFFQSNTIITLSLMYSVSSSIVCIIIKHWLPYLATFFTMYIPEQKISNKHSNLSERIKFITDSTIKPIVKPGAGQRKYYNGHYKFHGILTHLIVDYDGWILSVVSNVPGNVQDSNFANHSNAFSHIIGNDLVLADPGYQGVPYIVAGFKPSKLPKTEDGFRFDKISRDEQRHIEHINSWMKKNILTKSKKFNMTHSKLVSCFMIAAGMYNFKKFYKFNDFSNNLTDEPEGSLFWVPWSSTYEEDAGQE